MMRRITFVLVLFFLIVVFPISASTDWESYTNLYMYTIPGPSFYADLSNSAHVFDGSHGGNYSDNPSNNAYSGIDIVGIIGVADVSESDKKSVFTQSNEFTITCERIGVSADGNTWVYTSQSNPNIQFPFGLEFVLRANKWDGKGTGSTVTDFGTNGVVHLGYGSGGNESFTPIKTNPDWAAFWFDLVLVIPSEDELKASGIKYGAASDFQVELKLTLKDKEFGINKTFNLLLRGYYDTAVTDSSNGYIIFSVNPTNANIIPLSSLNEAEYSIGTYSYETTPIKSKDSDHYFELSEEFTSPIYMFVSANSDLYSQNNLTAEHKFYLKHEKASASNNATAVNIPFSIGLQSKNGGEKIWFDGDDCITRTVDSEGNSIVSNPIGLSGRYEYSSTRFGMEDIVILHDDGEILFKLGHEGESISNEEVRNNFVSGRYNSKIYIHIYSDI